jgi:hypothetical protein
MAFPSDDELRSPHKPLEFGGDGFEIVRFVYERGGDDRAHVDITWAHQRTHETVTYRFRSVVPKGLWPLYTGASVEIDSVRLNHPHVPRPLHIYQPAVDGPWDSKFYAGSVERLPKAGGTAAG